MILEVAHLNQTLGRLVKGPIDQGPIDRSIDDWSNTPPTKK